MESGIPPLPPPTPRGLGSGRGVLCKRAAPSTHRSPGLPPAAPALPGPPRCPRVRSRQLCPALGAEGKSNSEGMSGESSGALPLSPKSHGHRCTHTGQTRRTGVCREIGANSQVSKGCIGTILVFSPSLYSSAARVGDGALSPEARTALPSKPGEADPRHKVCIKMGRCVQGWERMTPVGTGGSGTPGSWAVRRSPCSRGSVPWAIPHVRDQYLPALAV